MMNTGKQIPKPSQRPYCYGVYGLSEWVALIPAGKARLRVRFAGGETSGFGRVPASFVTESRTVATLIENSEYFASGRIVRLYD